jgi:threonine dehydratase
VQWCFDRRLVVEPSGAAGVAAMLEYPQALGGAGRPLVIVLSGGNVGWHRLRDLLDAVDATAARPRT